MHPRRLEVERAAATWLASVLVVGQLAGCVGTGDDHAYFIITPEQGVRTDGAFAIGVYLTADGIAAGVASVDVSCDGAPVGTWSEGVGGLPCAPPGDSRGLALRGVAHDVDGALLQDRGISIDWHPTITLSFERCSGATCTPLAPGDTVTGAIEVRAVIDADIARGRVGRINVDGGPLIGEDHAAPFEATFDTAPLLNGYHTLAATIELDNGDSPYGQIELQVAN